jgi:PAS domain S-box-containing protein
MEPATIRVESTSRLFPLLFLPIALLIVGGAWYVGHDRIRSEMDQVRTSEIGTVIMGVRRLDDELALPLRQLRVLAATPELRQTLESGAESQGLQARFSDLIATTGIYNQIRWVDENGMERVRVNNVQNHPEVVAPEALQNVASRYYFSKSIQLKPGQVFISPLDLNIEHGEVSKPYQPVLRLATPVQDRQGHARGVLILNVLGNQLLDAFTTSLVEARDHAMLLNKDGYWLRGPDSKDDWGFMFQRKEDTLGSRYPEAWKAISDIPSGEVENADGMWTWSTVYPLKVSDNRDVTDLPHWLVVSHLPKSQLDLIGANIWPQVISSATLLIVLFGAITAWLTRALTGRTQARVEAAKALAEAAAERRLNESLERFHLIVEANVNGVMAIDSQGHIVLANPSLESMFGYSPKELLGKPMDILLPENKRDGHAKLRGAYLKSPVARPMGAGRQLTGRRKDGSEFPVEISLSPFTEHGEQFVDAIVVDLSARVN